MSHNNTRHRARMPARSRRSSLRGGVERQTGPDWRMLPRRSAMLALAGVLLAASAAAQSPPAPPRQTITIARAGAPPRLEDYATAEHRDGTRITGLLQRDPGDLTPATE